MQNGINSNRRGAGRAPNPNLPARAELPLRGSKDLATECPGHCPTVSLHCDHWWPPLMSCSISCSAQCSSHSFCIHCLLNKSFSFPSSFFILMSPEAQECFFTTSLSASYSRSSSHSHWAVAEGACCGFGAVGCRGSFVRSSGCWAQQCLGWGSEQAEPWAPSSSSDSAGFPQNTICDFLLMSFLQLQCLGFCCHKEQNSSPRSGPCLSLHFLPHMGNS